MNGLNSSRINYHEVHEYRAVLKLLVYHHGVLYWGVSQGRAVKGAVAGYANPSGYRLITHGKKQFAAHRLVFLLHHGWLPAEVDHDNLNRSDNRIENLRPATRSQNQRNTTLRCTNKSGVKNVSWDTAQQKWKVQIHAGKKIALGYYVDLELAELVAVMAREKYHGEFARHV